MRIAVLFDGAGLARLGLEQAGHTCTGVELDPWKHYLSKLTGSGNCILGNALEFDYTEYDAVWASPPCQSRSCARRSPTVHQDYVAWCLNIKKDILWVENVVGDQDVDSSWGNIWNAAQFITPPLQNRNRVIGGRHNRPVTDRVFKWRYPGICPTVLATEYKSAVEGDDRRKASKFFGRRLLPQDVAKVQGFVIPDAWLWTPRHWTGTSIQWEYVIYQALGNGVPCYMSKRFGEAHK